MTTRTSSTVAMSGEVADLENMRPMQQRLAANKSALNARSGAAAKHSASARCRTAFIDITNAVGKGLSDGKKGVLGVKKVTLKASNRTNNNNNSTNNNITLKTAAANGRNLVQTRKQTRSSGAQLLSKAAVSSQCQRRSLKKSAVTSVLAATASELVRLSRNRKSKKLRSVPTLSDLPSAFGETAADTADSVDGSSVVVDESATGSADSSEQMLTASASSLVSVDSIVDSAEPKLDAVADSLSCEKTELESATQSDGGIAAVCVKDDAVVESAATLDTVSGEKQIERQSSEMSASAALPDGVIDFDGETDDLYSVPNYASEVFQYYRQCEERVLVSERYLSTVQTDLTEMMRAILVDWMVEVQESFELNHETLYTAVRLVDIYLCHVAVLRDTLQLIGATALFIACKFDERLPPPLDDFLYICEDAYTRQEVIDTEIRMLRVVEFRLGLPISYRFLRRYARCCKLSMEVLTLSRYVLEMSLMEYSVVGVRGSLLAAAALTLALLMKMPAQVSLLLPTIQHYSGYRLAEFRGVMEQLNAMLHKPVNSHLKTIRAKYSHRVFFEVAKTALVDNPLDL